MIFDWLLSKTFAGAIPALLLISAIVSYLAVLEKDSKQVELETVAGTIVEAVEMSSTAPGEIWCNVSFHGNGLVIPRYIRGSAYRIVLAMNTVRLEMPPLAVSRDLPFTVHLYDPSFVLDEDQIVGVKNVVWDDLNRTDQQNRTVDVWSDSIPDGLAVRGLDLLVSGKYSHETFVYIRS